MSPLNCDFNLHICKEHALLKSSQRRNKTSMVMGTVCAYVILLVKVLRTCQLCFYFKDMVTVAIHVPRNCATLTLCCSRYHLYNFLSGQLYLDHYPPQFKMAMTSKILNHRTLSLTLGKPKYYLISLMYFEYYLKYGSSSLSRLNSLNF